MEYFDTYKRYPVTPVSAAGLHVTLDDGREVLDFYGGHAVVSIGHAHPRYVAAIREQVGRLGFYSNAVRVPLQDRLAAALGGLSGLDDYRLFLVNSGAEANENALKLAAWHTGRTHVLAFGRGWHGRTSAAVSVTDDPPIKSPINRGVPTEWLPLNDAAAAAERIGRGDLAAVIVEGLQGIGGIYAPTPAFLRVLAEACREAGTCLLLDEIQSGAGRTGDYFAFQHENPDLRPDFVTVAKGIGNGFPVGGVLVRPDHPPRKGSLGTTFGGNPLACAAALAVAEVTRDEGLLANARTEGDYLLSALRQNPRLRDVRGRGLMIGFEIDDGPAVRRRLLLERGVFVGSAKNPDTVRLLPPLTVDRAACDTLLAALREV